MNVQQHSIRLILALAATLLLAGCGDRPEAPASEPASSGGAQTSERGAALSPEQLRVKLAAADLFDGKEDRVVSDCSGCALAMAGKPENAIEVEGYELHMCSASCKAYFEKDLDGNLAALKIPQS